MGILDSLLGTSTASHVSNGMVSQDSALGNTMNGNSAILNRQAGLAQGALQNGTGQALGSLQTGASGALGQLGSGSASALQQLQAGYGGAQNVAQEYGLDAQAALRQQANSGVNTVASSNGLFQPYATTGTAADAMLANAAGLNGSAGNTAATQAFQASPGYNFQVQQATDAAARQAASMGMGGSGNTIAAVTQLAGNLANQGFGSYLDRLQGLSSQGQSAAQSMSGNNALAGQMQNNEGSVLANLINGTGNTLANYDANLGTGGANLASSLGSSSANVLSGLGSGSATLQSGLGTALANSDTALGNSLVNNNTGIAGQINTNAMNASSAQDAAQNASNGVLSKLLLGTPAVGVNSAGQAIGGSSGALGTLMSRFGVKL